jgi:hypothetical protein
LKIKKFCEFENKNKSLLSGSSSQQVYFGELCGTVCAFIEVGEDKNEKEEKKRKRKFSSA